MQLGQWIIDPFTEPTQFGALQIHRWTPRGRSRTPGRDYSVRVWPRDEPTAKRLLKGPRSGIESIALDAAGGRVAAGAYSRYSIVAQMPVNGVGVRRKRVRCVRARLLSSGEVVSKTWTGGICGSEDFG